MLAGLGRARESSRRQRAALPTPRGRGRQARPGQWAGSLGPALPSTGFLEPVGAFSFASRRPRLLSGRLSGLGVSVFLSLLLALYDDHKGTRPAPGAGTDSNACRETRGGWGQSLTVWLVSICLCDDGRFSFLCKNLSPALKFCCLSFFWLLHLWVSVSVCFFRGPDPFPVRPRGSRRPGTLPPLGGPHSPQRLPQVGRGVSETEVTGWPGCQGTWRRRLNLG